MTRKSYADRCGIKCGVIGETLESGVKIAEENRATTWETSREGIETLQSLLQYSYRSKGVTAELFGVYKDPETIRYAIFVKPGWLKPTTPED